MGVFHESPESAAKHIINIWDDVLKWWNSAEVFKAVSQFSDKYSKIERNPTNIIYDELINMIKGKAVE